MKVGVHRAFLLCFKLESFCFSYAMKRFCILNPKSKTFRFSFSSKRMLFSLLNGWKRREMVNDLTYVDISDMNFTWKSCDMNFMWQSCTVFFTWQSCVVFFMWQIS